MGAEAGRRDREKKETEASQTGLNFDVIELVFGCDAVNWMQDEGQFRENQRENRKTAGRCSFLDAMDRAKLAAFSKRIERETCAQVIRSGRGQQKVR